MNHHILKQQGGEGSFVWVFLVIHRIEVCVYFWETVELQCGHVYYLLGMHIVYDTASIMDYYLC